jgi:hypothetical protein
MIAGRNRNSGLHAQPGNREALLVFENRYIWRRLDGRLTRRASREFVLLPLSCLFLLLFKLHFS